MKRKIASVVLVIAAIVLVYGVFTQCAWLNGCLPENYFPLV